MAEAAPPRLYLITPPLAEPQAFAPLLESALQAGDVACVWLRLQPLAGSDIKKIMTALVPLAQKYDAALLVDDPSVAGRFDADGVHVAKPGADLEAALAAMKPDKAKQKGERIVGVSGLLSRHDAMTAGESNVDYVMFGGPDENENPADLLERVTWWADICTVPCVAYARDLADVPALAASGADFIALGDAIWQHEAGVKAAVGLAMDALAAAPEPAP
ncbi:MAG: thiamine phosphate synthase [Methylovirgula sp.]